MPDLLPGIEQRKWPAGSWSVLGQSARGRWFLFGDTRRATAFTDLTRWPPKPVTNTAEYAVEFDTLPNGRIVVCSMLTRPAGPYMVRVHAADWPTNPTAGALEEHPLPGGLTLADVRAVAGRVVTFGWLIDGAHAPGTHRAYLLDRGAFVPAPGLPAVTAFMRGSPAHQVHSNGKVTLADGSELLVWDGEGYEWNGTRFVRQWELRARGRGSDGWASVPWGADGFFYLSDGHLMHARRGHEPARVMPDAERAYFLSPGPDDSVIVCLYGSPKRHLARVWYPLTGEYVPLFRGHFGLWPSAPGGPLRWSAHTDRVYLSPVWAFPGSALAGLKRTRPRGPGYLVPKA